MRRGEEKDDLTREGMDGESLGDYKTVRTMAGQDLRGAGGSSSACTAVALELRHASDAPVA